MAFFPVKNVSVRAIGAIVPEKVVSNRDYDRISEEERQRLIQATGIRERRFVDSIETTTSDLSLPIAELILDKAGWQGYDVDVLLFVSQMRDYPLPCTAIILQDRLGLSNKCLAFDIPLGCSGYVYGMSVLASMLSSGGLKKGMLIAGDVCSSLLSYNDKSTFPLFGDASSCTLLEHSGSAPPMYFDLGSDGSGYEAIMIRDGGTRHLVEASSLEEKQYGEGIFHNDVQVTLDGYKIFEFSMTEVVQNIKDLLRQTGTSVDQIDHFVFHQANKLILDTVAKICKLPKEKVLMSLNDFGNTSSTSIPLTLVHTIQSELETTAKKLLISGFGVGLSWGSAIIDTDGIICPPLLTYKS